MTLPPFQRFLDAQREIVYRFLLGAVGANEADDCFQETFLAALRAYPDLRSDENLRGWVLTIARNKALDSHRSRARRPRPEAELELGSARDPQPPDDGLWDAVAELPDKQRAAIALRFACDLPHAEIAAAIDCSEEAARRSVHEGLKRLREVIR